MVRSTDRPAMTIAVDLRRKATKKQTNKASVSEEILLCFSHYKSIGAIDPLGVASLDPRELIGRIYVRHHKTFLHIKYISYWPLGLKEDF